MQNAGTHFLMCSRVNRSTKDDSKLEAETAGMRVQGTQRIEVRDRQGNPTEVFLKLPYRPLRMLPPVAIFAAIPRAPSEASSARARARPPRSRLPARGRKPGRFRSPGL